MYTFKMDIYIYKIIIKQSEKIVQTKIKSQKLKKKKKIQHLGKNAIDTSTNFVVWKQSRIWLRIISNPFIS